MRFFKLDISNNKFRGLALNNYYYNLYILYYDNLNN